jgi:4-amino-4-deoxy-L-arabinose transferase-like glycosyltransferase
MMIKLYPAVLFPIFIIPFIADKEWKEVIKGSLAFIITSLAVVLPIILFQPDLLSGFIGYHADRPLQMESVLASFIYPFMMLGLTDAVIEFGTSLSDNLVGPLPDALAPLMTPLMIASILAVYVFFAYMLKKADDAENRETVRLRLFANAVLLSVMLFIIMGKVFSAQYLIWMIPPFIFLLMVSPDRRTARNMLIVLIAAIALTQLEFAYIVGYLGGGANTDYLGMMIILVRNVMMIILLYLIVKAVLNCPMTGGRTADGSDAESMHPSSRRP